MPLEREVKVKILCSLCKNRVQSEVPYYADNVVLTVQCNAQSFSGISGMTGGKVGISYNEF